MDRAVTTVRTPQSSEAIQRQLDALDWNFHAADTRTGVHAIHAYPAKFIPQIPGQAIDLFHPGDGSAVLDPFCGSGTTLVEAVVRGVPAVGIDLHPLAILISKVKTTLLDERLTSLAYNVIENAKQEFAPLPNIPRINHWFDHHVQQELANLLRQIDKVRNDGCRDALRVAASSIIVRVSRQESDTRYAAIEKDVKPGKVYEEFLRVVQQIDSALETSYGGLFRHEPKVQLMSRDILSVKRQDIPLEIGLVVTSPPYPNAYEYWLYHKYRMYWLGMDPLAVKAREIGARPHFFKKNPHTADDFSQQMDYCFALFSQLLKRGRYVCLVVGRSVIAGAVVNNANLISAVAQSNGFSRVGQVTRDILSSRKTFNPTVGKIKTESLLVFEKQ